MYFKSFSVIVSKRVRTIYWNVYEYFLPNSSVKT